MVFYEELTSIKHLGYYFLFGVISLNLYKFQYSNDTRRHNFKTKYNLLQNINTQNLGVDII